MTITRDQNLQSSSFASTVVESALDVLRSAGVRPIDQQAVRNYLHSHPHVAAAIPEILRLTRDALGDGAALTIEVDSSSGPGAEYLVLLVHQPSYEDQILDTLRDLTRSARDLMQQSEPRFIITSDFATPS